MNIDLVINAKDRVCLVHDQPFKAVPLWVRYTESVKKIEIIFDNGTSMVLERSVPDRLHSFLLKTQKILLIRVEGMTPVEGYDTQLLREP